MVKWTLVAMMMLAGCSGVADSSSGSGGADPGAGGAAASSSASTGGGAGEGGGGTGDGPVDPEPFAIQNASCARGTIVGPAIPQEAGALAVGRFAPPRLPAVVDRFQMVRISGRGQCGDIDAELVYFAGDDAPPEIPAEVFAMPLPTGGEGVAELVVDLDPPLRLTEAAPYAYIGVRMAVEGEQSVCVGACEPSEDPDDSWWSSAAAAPLGWLRLSESPTPESAIQGSFAFGVSGTSL